MASKSDYTPEEWLLVKEAPTYAGFAVVAARASGPIGLVKEVATITRSYHDMRAQYPNNALIAAVADDLEQAEMSAEARGVDGSPTIEVDSDANSVRTNGVALCAQLTALLATKAPAEGEEYRRWILAVAHKVAAAAKEGGFLGFGGVAVSAEEQAMLDELAAALQLR